MQLAEHMPAHEPFPDQKAQPAVEPEFALAVACCRWPPSADKNKAVREAAAGVDWPLFLKVARRQRVEGLIWHALRQAGVDMPAATARPLQAAAQKIARQNLTNLAESARLRRVLGEVGAEPLFVKGLTLAGLAYGDVALKSGWDIDILVEIDAVEACADALEHEGYRLMLPPAEVGRSRLAWWHERWKESIWSNRARGTHVELHTRLVDNAAVLKGVGACSPRQEVEVSTGLPLPTLRLEELFAYLCVHGAASGWFRLKWAADVGALLSRCGEEETERLYRTSQELGAGRAAAQALLLCRFLFGTRTAPALLAELRSRPMNERLFRLALRNMAGRSASTELSDLRFGTLGIHLNQLAMVPGLRFKMAEAWRQLANPEHRLATRLPPPFHLFAPAMKRLRGGRG
jgi:hypothetical protein